MSARPAAAAFSVQWSPGLPRGFVFDGPPDSAVAVQPTGFLTGDAAEAAVLAGSARPVAGGPVAFSGCVVMLGNDRTLVRAGARLAEIADWLGGESAALEATLTDRIERISRPRPDFAGLRLDRARVIGVINVTPDSFSDGGDRLDPQAAIKAGSAMAEAGADLIDVGGESTRPGAEAPVSVEEEAARVRPVIEALARRGIAVSVDTRRAAVMRAALDAGAAVINDVSALSDDPAALRLAAESGAPVILMHKQGAPATMQHAPRYADAPYEVFRYLDARAAALRAQGHAAGAAAVDPGIGFGKDDRHNSALIAGIGLFHATGCPVALGVSRKSYIGRVSRVAHPKMRLAGSIAALAAAALQGVQLFRVHDVAETRQALAVVARLGGTGVL